MIKSTSDDLTGIGAEQEKISNRVGEARETVGRLGLKSREHQLERDEALVSLNSVSETGSKMGLYLRESQAHEKALEDRVQKLKEERRKLLGSLVPLRESWNRWQDVKDALHARHDSLVREKEELVRRQGTVREEIEVLKKEGG